MLASVYASTSDTTRFQGHECSLRKVLVCFSNVWLYRPSQKYLRQARTISLPLSSSYPSNVYIISSLDNSDYEVVLFIGNICDCENREMRQKSNDQLLLTTKLTIPFTRSDIVIRPRLFNKLEASKEHSLILLTAPAGFGKTVILSAWGHQQQSVCWVSLDSGDNDPVQFWSYVLTALNTLHPGLSEKPISMLQSEQPASIESILILVINALDALQQESVLILVDYHSIETLSIPRNLTFLLDHLPTKFHLVIASRTDPPLPLSRLRARHQLVELRVDDLRFTIAEAATFLNDAMGLHLTADDIAALETRTEGWIAGLQLAALSMQDREDIASFVSAFTGSPGSTT